MQFERKPMVGWYDVKQLMATAMKTVISSVFGNYTDKREIQAFSAQEQPFDFTDREDIWIDYISDLGDGFNSTYTMAHLLAKDEISVDGEALQRGDILIMGGDEVYPTPEKKEYQNRLQGPYNAAFPWEDDEPKEVKPKLFAIPGNHDWYDGLTNFIRLFCQDRALGNWLTLQKRSYFAIKLPHDYWLIGIDIQLKADIDEPQMAYFRKIAEEHIGEDDKVILCTAEPSWTNGSLSENFEADDRIRFFMDRVLRVKHKSLSITAVLTGDLHHYSRYETTLNKGDKNTHLITAGGGGAFMHPTHILKENIQFNHGTEAKLKAAFPSKSESKGLSWRNLAFPYFNWSMGLFLGIFHLFTAWILQSNSIHFGETSLMETISELDISFSNIDDYLLILFNLIKHSPSVVFLNLILFGGIWAFTDTANGKKKWNNIAGVGHGIFQLWNLYFWIWCFSVWNLKGFSLPVDGLWQIALFSIEMIAIGGLASGFIFGVYLLVSILVFQSHPTEASSSYSHEGYKNFLRMHLTKDKLTIYPIGIKNVVNNWTNIGTVEKPKFTGDEIEHELIENKLIIIPQNP